MWQIVGIILDIIGVGLLFFSTEKMNKLILLLISATADTIKGNTTNTKATLDYVQNNRSGTSAKSNVGLFLIIIGFICQLVSAIQQY